MKDKIDRQTGSTIPKHLKIDRESTPNHQYISNITGKMKLTSGQIIFTAALFVALGVGGTGITISQETGRLHSQEIASTDIIKFNDGTECTLNIRNNYDAFFIDEEGNKRDFISGTIILNGEEVEFKRGVSAEEIAWKLGYEFPDKDKKSCQSRH